MLAIWYGWRTYASTHHCCSLPAQGILTKFSDAYAFGVMLWVSAGSKGPAATALHKPDRQLYGYPRHRPSSRCCTPTATEYKNTFLSSLRRKTTPTMRSAARSTPVHV